jgi:hypothetical protein
MLIMAGLKSGKSLLEGKLSKPGTPMLFNDVNKE